MTRAWTIRTDKQSLIANLGYELNQKLMDLEEDGWHIDSVTPANYKEYDYPKYFDSVCYTIIATKS